MTTITLLIGMPGSGKSTLIDYLKQNPFKDYVIYDDWMKNIFGEDFKIFNSEMRYEEMKANVLMGKNVVISGITFCNYKFLCEAEYKLCSISPKVKIKRIYFENNVDKCIKNVTKRAEDRGGYWFVDENGVRRYYGLLYGNNEPLYLIEIGKIKEFSKHYVIPEQYTPIKIKTKTEIKKDI